MENDLSASETEAAMKLAETITQKMKTCVKKRVVITGMGVVSPNGTGKEEFCRAILAGTSGVRRITRFDVSDLPVQIAGEVQGFDELAWVDFGAPGLDGFEFTAHVADAGDAVSDEERQRDLF